MPRNYWLCPACNYKLVWAFIPPPPDPDMGLVIGAHIELAHPEMLYGSLIPLYLAGKLRNLVVVGNSR